MFEQDTSAEAFQQAWGEEGYTECFDNYPPGSEERVAGAITKYSPLMSQTALEIGAGSGFWTEKYLRHHFKEVICLDVIVKPKGYHDWPNVHYIKVPDRDFDCAGVPSNSVDFVWSFGCFCHLSVDACGQYLKGIHRVLKPGGAGIVMLANANRHPGLSDFSPEFMNTRTEDPEIAVWFYQHEKIAEELVKQADLIDFEDVLPDFRDTLAYFKKGA